MAGRALILLYFVVAGAVAAMAGGFLAVILIVAYSGGLLAIPAGLFIGIYGIWFGLQLASLPAIVIGGLLWGFGVRSKWAWAGAGALAGVGLYVTLFAFPGLIGETLGRIEPVLAAIFALAAALAAAPAALLFRLIMDTLTAFNQGFGSD